MFLFLLLGADCYAQFNRGMGMGRGMGRRTAIPQAQHAPPKEEPKTADQIVNDQMPSITQALELNDFETAIMGSILKRYVQERIEAQILKLTPEKMREVYKDISERQDEEIKSSLPPEKYDAFLKLQEEGLSKTIKKKKKEKKKKRKNEKS
ncbi:hypothetical protein [Maribacter sp. 2307ULW6-5]|uniref:hypothetical protein n=1 Tax=Maribacter sp. 2307ULW6-5 TaxID=3386275 RepID=UPI0039BD096A